MIRNTLWGAAGIALSMIGLWLTRHQFGIPRPLPYGWLSVWLGGFIVTILLLRLADIIFKGLFARHPGAERFVSGLLIGAWLFTAIYLHT